MPLIMITKYTTLKAICRRAGYPYCTAYYRLRRGDFAPPSHVRPNGVRPWYTVAEGEKIYQLLKELNDQEKGGPCS